MEMIQIFKDFTKKNKNALAIGAIASMTTVGSAFAAAPTGDADLDTLINSMTAGGDTIKSGGLYIVGAVIAIAVVFFGARWLWNMWRGWMSRAQ